MHGYEVQCIFNENVCISAVIRMKQNEVREKDECMLNDYLTLIRIDRASLCLQRGEASLTQEVLVIEDLINVSVILFVP